MNSALKSILSKWVTLGASFNIEPSTEEIDLEVLILDSALFIQSYTRLKAMMVLWLSNHEYLVCRHRLASLIKDQASLDQSAILGFLLSAVTNKTASKHYNLAIKECRPLPSPRPLYDIDRKNPKSIEFAKKYCETDGLKWGIWATEVRDYKNALRPLNWIMSKNPYLHYRAIFRGKLQSTIISFLLQDSNFGSSETLLAKTCFTTRANLRIAIEHLEMCGLLIRKAVGSRNSVELINTERLSLASSCEES